MGKGFAGIEATPNPFRTATTVHATGAFSLGRFSVFDLQGRKVADLSGSPDGPRRKAVWNAAGLAPGIYFLRAETGKASIEKKLMLLK
jgi:hypothetical protein